MELVVECLVKFYMDGLQHLSVWNKSQGLHKTAIINSKVKNKN